MYYCVEKRFSFLGHKGTSFVKIFMYLNSNILGTVNTQLLTKNEQKINEISKDI